MQARGSHEVAEHFCEFIRKKNELGLGLKKRAEVKLTSLGALRHSPRRGKQEALRTLLAEIALKRQFDKGFRFRRFFRAFLPQEKSDREESKGGALTERLFEDGTSPSFEKFLNRKCSCPLIDNFRWKISIKNGLRPSPPPLPRQSLPPRGSL